MVTRVLAFLLLLFLEPILAKQQVDEEFLRNNRTIERVCSLKSIVEASLITCTSL